jgi:hypothetical protein
MLSNTALSSTDWNRSAKRRHSSAKCLNLSESSSGIRATPSFRAACRVACVVGQHKIGTWCSSPSRSVDGTFDRVGTIRAPKRFAGRWVPQCEWCGQPYESPKSVDAVAPSASGWHSWSQIVRTRCCFFTSRTHGGVSRSELSSNRPTKMTAHRRCLTQIVCGKSTSFAAVELPSSTSGRH